MALQCAFFYVPVLSESEQAQDLNKFLANTRVTSITKELAGSHEFPHWAFCVEYLSQGYETRGKAEFSKKKVDYREVLTPEDFAVYSQLREWRKGVAIQEAVQVYTVFVNEQLASMVKSKVVSKEGLLGIEGIGNARVEKYGDAVLGILQAAYHAKEENRKCDE